MGLHPMDAWPTLLFEWQNPYLTVFESYLLSSSALNYNLLDLHTRVSTMLNEEGEALKSWWWDKNASFFSQVLLHLLNDDKLKNSLYKSIWKKAYPLKIKFFNWLTLDKKILTMKNLANRNYNRISMTTCVFCQIAVETVDDLLVCCLFAAKI